MIGKNPQILAFYRGIRRQASLGFRQERLMQHETEFLWPTREWQTATPESHGMKSSELARFVEALSEPSLHVDSIILARHGRIMCEAYFHPYASHYRHHVYSVTKSVISALIGVAIKQGYISSVNQPVADFFPDVPIADFDVWKKRVTLEHLLTMTSGFDCDWASENSVDDAMRASHDWVQFALSLPMVAEPGTEFHYCNANAHLLSAILSRTTGMSALQYANQNIFAPLGIKDIAWTSTQSDINHGAGELQFIPRDLAKLGYLILRKGAWEDRQIVPANWVDASTSARIAVLPDFGYGYMWWTLEFLNASMAVGFGGQYLWLFPSLDLVVTITGGATDDIRFAHQLPRILSNLLNLTFGDHSLPEEPDDYSQLQDLIHTVKNPNPVSTSLGPESAHKVSEKSYRLLTSDLLTNPSHTIFRIPKGMDGRAWDTRAVRLISGDKDVSLVLTFADGSQIAILVGIDGLYRITEGRLGVVAAKGEWLTDTAFRLHLQHVGDCTRYRMDLTFSANLLEIIAFETAGGRAHVVFGLAIEE